MKLAAAYIRVSTEDQMDLSPDSQLEKIREYAVKNDMLLLDQYIFHDDGISGRSAEKRPGFQQMIATAKEPAHPFDSIIVWKFSRFARNQEESIFYKSILRSKCNVDVVSVSEPLIAGHFGSLIERIIEWMDEFYSVRLSEEVKRSMTVNAKNGVLQSTPSFGYCVYDHQLVIVPEEADIIREIFSRFISGDAMFAIAKDLSARGIRTHRGNPFENRTVDYILNNPVYIGKLRWTPTGRTRRNFKNEDSIISEAQHEPIIDLQTWDAAQARCAELKKSYKRYGKPSTERKHWLCGIVRCSTCGATLIWSNPAFLKCNNYAHGRCSTTQHIRVDLLEEAFIDRLRHDVAFAESVSCTVQVISRQPQTQSLQQKRSRLVSRMERLRESYLDGIESLESYRDAKQKMQQQLDDLDAQIASMNRQDETSSADLLRSSIAAVLKTLTDPTATTAQKYESAMSIIDRCIFDKSQMLLSISYKLTV
ncbi:MAG: recombinase family protein [Methanocorpusculum sp.]|nr:recombinase family protein [Methanocorpusculum sp.]